MSSEPNKAAEPAEAGGKKLSRKEKKAAKENVIGGVTEEKLKADQKKKEKEEEAAKAQEEAKKGGKSKGKERFETKTAEADTTPAGQKKDMSQPMADAYYPQLVESAWDLWWEKQGYFTAKPEDLTSDKEKFVIVIPPPNVTGTLHIGHALTNSIEDVLVRWNRMCGKVTLWVPGSDHAGIATQVVVEKQLKKTTGQSRHDLGRERFLERVWAWKEENGNHIFKQLRRLGVSVDWSRAAFTMDEPRSKAVQEAFIRMFNSDKIYRSNRLVSWSCTLRTAISNIEVDYKDIETITHIKVPGYEEPVEFGAIHSFQYKLADGSGHITVATTRIETMLGDVAVAVHSSDPRYQKVIGKDLVHPFVPDRKIKVIADDVLVDPKFGTGAVKVTPGHDPNDFECGIRNKLQFINIFTDDGFINENGGRFKGTPRFVARKVIIEELQKLGQYVRREPNNMRLGFCSRSGDVIEPVIRPQWWVRTGGMAKKAADAVRNGELQIIPPMYNDTWFRWLDNNQDWCISRQLWWGHRIPAYQVTYNGRPAALAQEDAKHTFDDVETASWVAANSEAEALEIAAKKFPSLDRSHFKVTQDEDVLDTWFSSGLFPFAVFNWPNNTLDLKAFYPNTLLETGHDILFFWVARMVMMGQELMGTLPFSKVYLHGLVRDKDGKKMSKSKGNVIDPLDVINGASLEKLENNIKSGNLDKSELERALANVRKEFPTGIAECGSDALRYGLLSYVSGGRDINLDVLRIVAYRQFCNKLWNATKFGIDRFGSDFQRPNLATVQKTKFSAFADRWILSRLHACVQAVDAAMKQYEFADATQSIFDFTLKELCDVYLEVIKPRMYADVSDPAAAKTRLEALTVLYTCYDRVLRLLHPMMPFLTEELYQRLPDAADKAAAKSPSIMIAPYPVPADSAIWSDPTVETDMGSVMELIRTTRSARASLGLAPKQKINAHIFTSSKPLASAFAGAATEISVLCNAAVVDVLGEESKVPAGCLSTVVNAAVTVHIPLQGLLDLSDELLKLDRKTTTILKSLSALEKSMNAPGYEKTPDKVRAEHKSKVDAQREELSQLRQSIATFESLVSLDTLRALHSQKLDGLNKDLSAAEKEVADAEKKLSEDAAKPEADRLKDKARSKLEELIKTKQQDAQSIKAAIAAAESEFQTKAAAKAKK